MRLLAAELERARLRGENPPGADMILEELRAETRDTGRKLPRLGNAQRLFFAPVEPFLVDDTPERKHRGRIARACLDTDLGMDRARSDAARGEDLCGSGQPAARRE